MMNQSCKPHVHACGDGAAPAGIERRRALVFSLALAVGLALSVAAHASEVPDGAYWVGGLNTGSETGSASRAYDAAPKMYAAVGGVALKRNVEVNGSFVTLGDLFVGLSEKTDVVVARAPKPGKSIILDATWLAKAATAYDMSWRPNNSLVQTVVTRPGVTVPQNDIKTALLPVLRDLGAPAHMTLEITSARESLNVPPGAPFSIRVMNESFDPLTRRFSAVVEAPAGMPDAQRVQVSGRFTDTRTVPILTRRLSRGQTITPADIDYVDLRADQIPVGAILNPDEMIGKEPRNILKEGEPIRRSDVLRPEVVRRNALVTMEVSIPGLNATARGRAMEAGGEGDLIRVQNVVSKQIVLATVVDPSRVSVGSPSSGPVQSAER